MYQPISNMDWAVSEKNMIIESRVLPFLGLVQNLFLSICRDTKLFSFHEIQKKGKEKKKIKNKKQLTV
jgi:hypothetical protein